MIITLLSNTLIATWCELAERYLVRGVMATKKSAAKRKPSNNFDKKYDAMKYRDIIPEIVPVRNENYEESYDNIGLVRQDIAPSLMPATINNVNVSTPSTFRDIQELVNSLRRHEAVIVDMSRIHPDCVERVLDYLSGAVFALEGTEKSVSKTIYMFTPKVNTRRIY